MNRTFDSPFLLRQGEPGTSQYITAQRFLAVWNGLKSVRSQLWQKMALTPQDILNNNNQPCSITMQRDIAIGSICSSVCACLTEHFDHKPVKFVFFYDQWAFCDQRSSKVFLPLRGVVILSYIPVCHWTFLDASSEHCAQIYYDFLNRRMYSCLLN